MDYIGNYFEKGQYTDENEMLFYAIMYRQWEKTAELIGKKAAELIRENPQNSENIWECIGKELIFSKHADDPEITIEKCFQYNLDFLKSEKNKALYRKLCGILGTKFKELKNDNEENTYDYKGFCKNKSVLDVFWNGSQPVLNLKYYEKQTMAARQVMNHSASIVLDEVGTGKTVTGIFTMQQVIQQRIDELKENEGDDTCKDQAAILIICPYNKREDWQSDILRQLGRKSVVIDQSDDGKVLIQKSCRRGIPHIYISGNTGGSGDGSNHQLKLSFRNYHGKPWDLVIIDECHQCFENYKDVKADKVLMLTATPIVVNSNGTIKFKNYYEHMKNMIDKPLYFDIDPINKQDVSESDSFVCNFKEDIFENITIDRQITFIECDRDSRRQEWFGKLHDEKGFFAAIYADQDDDRLAAKMAEVFPEENYLIEKNHKLETLAGLILNDNQEDSFLIFCETKGTVDLIYEKISGYASAELMIGKLHSDTAEIKNKQTNKDRLIPMLIHHIQRGKEEGKRTRSILITTGKSGGTGLNLGAFDTVVHYELPFSSNALEQRFGRIERADDLIAAAFDSEQRKTVKNKMIFLINKAVDGQIDFDTNRMLYYAVNKIHVTARHMPIRNTVLFHPQYMERVKKEAMEILGYLQNSLYEETTQTQIHRYFEYIKKCDEIEDIIGSLSLDDEEQKKFTNKNKKIEDRVDLLRNHFGKEKLSENSEITINEFFKNYVDASDPVVVEDRKKLENISKSIKIYIEYYLYLRKTLSFWGADECLEEQDLESIDKKYSDAFEEKTKAEDPAESREDSKEKTKTENLTKNGEDSEENFINSLEEIFKELKGKSNDQRISWIHKAIGAIQKALDQVNSEHNNYSGVFYYRDSKIENKRFSQKQS